MRTILPRTAVAVAIAVSMAACKSETDASAPSSTTAFDWSQRSPDGKVEIRQRRESKGDTTTCRVQAYAGEKQLWSGTTCIPAPSVLVFFSRDAEKLLVLDLFPSAAVQSSDWSNVSVAQLWKKGAVVRAYKGGEVLAADRARDMRTSFSWIRGETYEQIRESARAVGDGTQVSVDLADGRTVTFGFDEKAALPTPPSVSARPRASELAVAPDPAPAALPDRDQVRPAAEPEGLVDGEIYRWQDETGATQFGTGATVPAKYQKSARPVRAHVGVVPTETIGDVPPPPAPSQPSRPAQTAQPAQPAQPATGGAADGAGTTPPASNAYSNE